MGLLKGQRRAIAPNRPDIDTAEVETITTRIIADLQKLDFSEVLEAIRRSDVWNHLKEEVITIALEDGGLVDADNHREELNKVEKRLNNLLERLANFEPDAERLHEAICEGRTDDADTILRRMVPDRNFRSIGAQQRLAAARNGQANLL